MLTDESRKKLVAEIDESICISDILDDILVSIAQHCAPEDVFDTDALNTWAEKNDYKKEVVDPDVD